MDLIKNLKRASDKKFNDIDFTSKDFMDFIKNAKTINLYTDGKNGISEFIQKFINNDTLNKSITIDFDTIGKMFMALILYKLAPSNYNDKENRKLLKLSKDQWEQVQELINIYNLTMIHPYKQRLNGLKGGAPKKNNNAKRGTAATDVNDLPTIADYDTNQDYE